MSLYNTLAEERGYKFRIWPALYPTDKEIIQYKGRLAPWIVEKRTEDNIGHTTDPDRFSDADLDERLMSYGKAGFALQFMLNTSLSDMEKYPLRCADLIVMESIGRVKAPIVLEWGQGRDMVMDVACVGLAGDRYYRPAYNSMVVDGEAAEYTGKVLAIDPSGRGKDETGYAVGFMLNGNIYVPEAGGLKGGYDDPTMIKLCQIAKKHQVNAIVIESNFGDGMYTKLFQAHLNRIYPCFVEEIRVSGMKEQRIIDTLEPVMMQHRLVIARSVIEQDLKDSELDQKYSLFYQMTRLTNERGALGHDDRLDALALMVQYWTDQMNADADAKAEEWRSAMIEAELESFMSGFGAGLNRQTGNWLTLGHHVAFK